MRSSSEALRIALLNINQTAQDGKYRSAARLATNFIKLAYNLESKTEVFVGEVLEAIYVEIDYELETYEVPSTVKNDLKKKLGQHMAKILVAYDTQGDLYGVLVDMRNDATTFQFTVPLQHKMRKPNTFPSGMGAE